MSNKFSPILLGARYLNDVNAQYLGSGGTDPRNPYSGMLGQEIELSAAEAAQLTNTAATGYSATTPLLAGTYKLVKVDSTCTITPARGLVAWWDASAALDSFIVTPDAPTAATQMAGIFIGAPTPGYYCWILVQGEAYLLGKASALTQTGAAGQLLSPVVATGAWDNDGAVEVTDSTTGTSTTRTFAAGVGVYDLTLPVPANLSTLSTGGVDVATGIVLGHKFKILSWEFITTVAGTGAGASLVFNLEIGSTDVGTVVSTCTVTLAGTSDIGERTAATAVSGANTGTSTDALSLEVAGGGTAFTAGSGYFVIKVQNMDTADAIAGIVSILADAKSGNRVIAFETPVAGSLKRAYVGPLVSSPISGLQ